MDEDTNQAPQNPELMPMAPLIQDLLTKIEEAIEEQLQTLENIKAVGSPYEASLLVVQKRKLEAAAASVLATIVNHPSFAQIKN
jgi:hypothetical protein